MKNILIWGATGSLGVYVVDYLNSKIDHSKYKIIAIGRRKTDFFASRGVEYLRLDVNDVANFSLLPDSHVHSIVHLANLLPARVDEYDPSEYIRVNTIGTLNILEYMRRVCAEKILFTQSYADLGGHFEKEFVLGNHLSRKLNYCTDHTVYSISKIAAEDLIINYHHEYGIGGYIFRLPNVYLYSPEKYYYVNGKKTLISYRYIIERAIAGLPIELWGDPLRSRDIVYVKDFCQMVYLAILSERGFGHYNVGTGVATTLKDQIDGIVKVFSPPENPSEIIFRPEMRNAMHYVMDIENAKTELGYAPKYNYLDYLRDYKAEMDGSRFAGLYEKEDIC